MVSNEELISILLLQVTCNVQTSLKIFSQSEEPTQRDSFCHNFCEIYQPASVDNEISNFGCYLVLQLKYFVNYNGNFLLGMPKPNLISSKGYSTYVPEILLWEFQLIILVALLHHSVTFL